MADIEAIKTATIHCMGLAFLSRWSVKNELALGQLRIVRISDLLVRRGFYWVLPSGALGRPSDTFVCFWNGDRPQLISSRDLRTPVQPLCRLHEHLSGLPPEWPEIRYLYYGSIHCYFVVFVVHLAFESHPQFSGIKTI